MPIKNFDKFEKFFFEDGKFNTKIYEAYWGDYGYRDRDEEGEEEVIYGDYGTPSNIQINYEKLALMGLLDYQDIVEKSIPHFLKLIGNKNYGDSVIPPLDDIVNHIIGMIGVDYKGYISDDNLDNLSRFIYQEIENYIFD